MKNTTKIWLAVAAALVLVGGLLFAGTMAMGGWDFNRMSTGKYQTNEHTIQGIYQNISIVTETADIAIVPSGNRNTTVVCYEQESVTHSVTVRDDTLVIEAVDERKWYEYVGIHFDTPQITVYIPEGEWGALSVETATGNITVPEQLVFERIHISGATGSVTNRACASEDIKVNITTGSIAVDGISAGSMDLTVTTGGITVSDVTCDGDISVHVSTGKAVLTDISCGNLTSTGSTGSISLKNVIGAGTFSITRSTGDVRFDGSDAGEIFVETDTGDVEGSLLTDKVFFATTDTGSVHVPKTVTGGRCEISTDTGDITITIHTAS